MRVSAHSPLRSGHILCRSHVTVTVSSEFFRRLCSVSDPALRSLSCVLQVCDTLSSGLLCSNSRLQRQMPSTSSPRRLARTCTSALHVSSVPNLVWMPMPSQIDCRQGSRVSPRIQVLSRDVSSPFFRKFQLSERIILLRQNSSSLTDVFLTKQKRVVLSHCVTPPLVLLQRLVLSCPVAVCVHVHERRKSVDLDRALCARNTLQVSRDALHVHLVALSGTRDLSCRFP